jgi:DNA-binding transcriptional regulator LsrR (DeoR family)
MPVDIPIAETREPPVYQRIATEAAHLRDLGMTYPEIGKRLGIDRWTVGKAVRWLRRQRDAGSVYSNSSID